MYNGKFVSAVIAAAGMSNRMGAKINKQFIAIGGKPVLAHTIEKFEACGYVDEIILVAKQEEIEYCKREIVKKYGFRKVCHVVRGGKERQESVYNGLLAMNPKAEIVLTHDGARPFVDVETLMRGVESVELYGATVVGVPVKDTIKVVDESLEIEKTPVRSKLWAAQTPQCFQRDVLMEGHRQAILDGFWGTDDGSLVERIGYHVRMIMGTYENIKITTPDDVILSEALLLYRSGGKERYEWQEAR